MAYERHLDTLSPYTSFTIKCKGVHFSLIYNVEYCQLIPIAN
ncbi:hypothetical protein VCHA50O407_30180 [Vibrio chagasii]|nr:hypothetical protein VCHA29O39_10453 [Vibrio chagasii]CAH7015735.1 hypothetical protein VCHA37P199_140155 [Vibrio chagasii]CAH7288864.1 hypothetical protein VCHA50O407_30180 [Vibrio chagasii]CAH7338507.1 hypothetical protein VCHA50P424_40073 [Vibrio chagasii]